ncbi:MAG: hypothetical protein GKR92_05210 [Gammaproteobacteria bacterium]|nr:MAG: hypothetical protein GKR92_05210 [Gammaproteobacteria bacterium]
MQATEKALINFFEQVALKNKALLTQIEIEQSFDIDNKRWQFTLPNLHSFLQNQNNVFSSVDYLTFRNILYNSPINQTVKIHGAEINISDNQAKVDKSRYALIWNNKVN